MCKASVTAANVIPLYGRGGDNVDPRRSAGEGAIPSRPVPQRTEAPPVGFQGGTYGFTMGVGFFPSLFGLQWVRCDVN